MVRDGEQTREAILKSAQAEFLAKGFSAASLRKIATGAEVTTGALYRHFTDKAALFEALVSPCFHGFIQMFRQQGEDYLRGQAAYDFDHNWSSSEQSLLRWTEYIYDHLEVFKLLLSAAEKTAYESFVHILIEMEVDMTLEYIRLAREKGYMIKDVSREEIHIFVNAQFSAFFEMVLHDVPRERAVEYTSSIFRFFAAGWKKLFIGA